MVKTAVSVAAGIGRVSSLAPTAVRERRYNADLWDVVATIEEAVWAVTIEVPSTTGADRPRSVIALEVRKTAGVAALGATGVLAVMVSLHGLRGLRHPSGVDVPQDGGLVG